MSIRINEALCKHCGACVEVCPGNLIGKNAAGAAVISRPDECWGCASCLKECRFGAIDFFLGADIGGRGATMQVRQDGDLMHWTIRKPTGEETTITVNKRDANQY